jgi:drug/metabolite transporter (DMT)-like permease
MTTRSTGAGFLIALLSAAAFATSGPFAKSLLETGWTPGSVVFLRIAGAALLLVIPAARALGGRWYLLRRGWKQVVGYGVGAVAVPQLAFFYAVQHLSVGVALLLEYLGLVLVVAWQCLVARRLPRTPTVIGILLAVTGLVLVLDLFGGVQISGVGVMWGLIAAVGLASYFLLSGHAAEEPLPPLTLAGGGLVVGALSFAVLGLSGVLPMTFVGDPVTLAGVVLPGWAAVVELAVVAAATAYVAGIMAARVLGAKLASFVGLSEVLFAVLFAWVLLGELPRPVQLLGGLFIVAGVVAVRFEEAGDDGGGPSSAVEPCPPVGLGAPGDASVVTHDPVELDGVDVTPPQDDRGAVGAVQE